MLDQGKILLATITFLCIVSFNTRAQISAPWADDKTAAVYDKKDSLHTDTVYVFNRAEYNASRKGSLIAQYGDSVSGDTLFFAWSKYNAGSHSFDTAFFYDTSNSFSNAANLNAGGYRVQITDTGILDTAFYAWVHINDMYVFLENDSGKLEEGKHYICEYVQPKAILKQDTFYYYYPFSDTAEAIKLPDAAIIEWTSDNAELTIPGATFDLNPRIYDAPAEDTEFYFSAVDSFGCKREGAVFYESIHTKADFEIKIQDIYDEQENKGFDGGSLRGSSHIKAIFINNSVNGETFEWDLGDTLGVGNQDIEFDVMEEYDTNHVYYVPGNYYVKLTSISEELCEDVKEHETPINVRNSDIPVIPNYFSPGSTPGVNDYFKIYALSIDRFEISIVNRWGKVVHEFSGRFADWLPGWDGKIKDSDRDAPPDVYYYIIRARGWEQSPPKRYQGEEYTGEIFLFR